MSFTQISFAFDEEPVEKVTGQKAVRPKEKKVVTTSSIAETKKSARGRMKLKDMEATASLVQVPPDDILFEKKYYSMKAVAEMFQVKQSLLRFWENEFDILKPKKNGKGDRLFRPEDVKNLKLIHHLLREKKYTIEGAKDFIKKSKRVDDHFMMIECLKNIKIFLIELKTNL